MMPSLSYRWERDKPFRKLLIDTAGVAPNTVMKKWADLSTSLKEKLLDAYYGKGHEFTVKQMDDILKLPMKKVEFTPLSPNIKKKKR